MTLFGPHKENPAEDSSKIFLKQLETLLGIAKIGIDIIDSEFNVRYIDPAWEKIYGPSKGRKCYEYFMGRNSACPTCGIPKALETKEVNITEEILVKEGSRPIQVITIPFEGDDGEWLVAEVNIDITERKKAEEVLRRDKETFEKLVNERTRELLKAQVELDKARHLSEIGALAATVAHELRNPLAAIRTAAYNIKRKAQNPLLANNIANIEKKILEANQIINNLLSYSHIRMPRYENIRIHETLDECIRSSKERFPEWKVAVVKKYKITKKDFVKVDPIQMKEIFDNILNNAYESFPDKKGKIRITAEKDTKEDIFKIRFEDNGSGIDPEDLKRLSEPFFTTKSKGMGLGLSVCYQLASLHDGKVDVESEKGKGTTVTVTIPIKKKS